MSVESIGEDFRAWCTVGDHDGHHPFACDVCQVVDLAVKGLAMFAAGWVKEALTESKEARI